MTAPAASLFVVLLATTAGSLVSLGIAAAFLAIPERTRGRVLPHLVGYAAGTLLAGAFIALLPHAAEEISAPAALRTALAGIVLFFLLERLVLWRHCHDGGCEIHAASGPLILIGDAFHNFVDGAIIAAAFTTSVPLGIATALAVFSHEIPQELGDFAILLGAGYSRTQALLFNALSAASALLGATGAYLFLSSVTSAIPHVMAIAAAGFVYIALGDLIPSLNREAAGGRAVLQVLLLAAGIGTIALLHALGGE